MEEKKPREKERNEPRVGFTKQAAIRRLYAKMVCRGTRKANQAYGQRNGERENGLVVIRDDTRIKVALGAARIGRRGYTGSVHSTDGCADSNS